MKCLLCPNEIDETRGIHRDDLNAQRVHSSALEKWRQLTIHVGNLQVLTGHLCPDESADGIRLVNDKKAAK